ncbi:hypothetical protein K7432_001254 [Basidiobolus ranarum]|uniref:Uncharacterized protein n=1 Tax=Basidiobolus ranarum TaxID=34480 RepID=A0ABR2W9Y3_9FUNG
MAMLSWINSQVFGGRRERKSTLDNGLSEDWVILPSSTIHWTSPKPKLGDGKHRSDKLLFSPPSQHRFGRDITRSYMPIITDRDNLIKKLQHRESMNRLQWTPKRL